MLIFNQGEHDKAKPMLEQALRIRRKQSGNEHRDVAECLNNLAQLASDQVFCMHQNKKTFIYVSIVASQGDEEEARSSFEEAIAIWRKCLGNEHPQVAVGLNNLAVLLKRQVSSRNCICSLSQ